MILLSQKEDRYTHSVNIECPVVQGIELGDIKKKRWFLLSNSLFIWIGVSGVMRGWQTVKVNILRWWYCKVKSCTFECGDVIGA